MRKKIKPSDNPKPFTKDYNGRKGKVYVNPQLRYFVKLVSDGGFKMDAKRMKTAIEYLLGMPIEKVREIAGSPADEHNKYPIAIRLVAVALLRDGFDALMEILKQIHGQTAYLKVESSQRIEVVNGLSEDAMQRIHALIAESSSADGAHASDSDFAEFDEF
jgi:hypothetical protein